MEYSCTEWNILAQNGIFLNRMEYSCTELNFLAQNGTFLLRMEYSCSEWNILAQNGIFLLRMECSCKKWNNLAKNGFPCKYWNFLQNENFFFIWLFLPMDTWENWNTFEFLFYSYATISCPFHFKIILSHLSNFSLFKSF